MIIKEENSKKIIIAFLKKQFASVEEDEYNLSITCTDGCELKITWMSDILGISIMKNGELINTFFAEYPSRAMMNLETKIDFFFKRRVRKRNK